MKKILCLLAMLGLPLLAHGQTPVNASTSQPAAPVASAGVQINVNCGNPRARVKTIADGLKLLGNQHPATLLISGTCHENVTIQSLDRITLQGNPTATIDGGSDPNYDAVDILDSQDITLANLTITGGASGLVCFLRSLCGTSQVTIENSLGFGVQSLFEAHLTLGNSVVQGAGDVGIYVGGGSFRLFGGSITGNASDGIRVRNGGHVFASASDLKPTVDIQNNGGNGVDAFGHSTVGLSSVNITGNAGDGVAVQGASELNMVGANISNNLGHQVRIGILSFVHFGGGPGGDTITGTNAPDVVCDQPFSAVFRFTNLVGTTTNCPAEVPPTP